VSIEPSAPITEILASVESGETEAWSKLFALVYQELEDLASARLRKLRPGDTIRTTDLVHESCLKLLGAGASFSNRRHFFGAASRAMRDILVDEARRRGRAKRGGGSRPWELGDDLTAREDRTTDLLALDDVLDRLESEDALGYQVVMLRYFGGLTVPETAEVLEISPSTVDRRWSFARAWLLRELRDS